MSHIYKITNDLNGKRYIGKSRKDNPNYYGSGIAISRAIQKYGKENFTKEILERCSNETVDERERYYISLEQPEYNIAAGGNGGDTSKYMTDTQKKEYNYKKGKSFRENNPMLQEENRQKVSERMKKHNPAHTHPENNPFLNNSYVKGRKWYNNGVENIYIYDNPPEGYVAGMVYKPRKKTK